ncbi:DUF7948 domain-containing protein [Cloacibacterium normanense]|uniref:Gliding motility-associated C-terminal domain protein n=1 Tax=Cloacibacterium normanense TaxID=237258 RepID=A0A1E5UF40_9FLAO|nr:T9SS type B sorting domain-containing protein [Cloacibacterium normanense]AZI69205.1 hypothetical protein EB819_04640 [Cloacibacterium normanense]OEL11407.1 gliding motility-associated C-terminal domain protein [Cloacibacterium normanense]SDO15441.1 gliding motility-associated C-terminal domain-containing protein [Cloacibacterium normanense]
MKKIYFLFIFSFFISVFSQQKLQSQSDFYFYENKGQIIDQKGNANSKVKYLFNSGGLNVQIKKEGFSYDVYEVEKTKKKKSKVENSLTALDRKPKDEFDYKFKFHRVDIDFLNANKNPEIIAEGKSTDYENYYNIPHKPEGVTEVHRYQKITYKNIYPNIDLVFFKPKDSAKTIEYNFIIHPKGKISDIKLKFKGAKTKLKDGKLSMNLRFGEMQENIPHSWMEEPSKKTDLSVQFREMENGVFGFAAPQDSFDKTVVIDPVPTRIWGTFYYGDSYYSRIKKIRADYQNNIFVTTCVRYINNFATTGAFQSSGYYLDEYASLTKFNPDGSRNWATLIGNPSTIYTSGAFSSIINDFQINSSGEIYIVGNAADDLRTIPNNITTPGSHKQFASISTREGIIMKFNNTGQRIWGTYFGDDGFDDIYSLSLDMNEDLFIGGKANSKTGIATTDGYITSLGNWNNGFFAKFSKTGNHIYGSYLIGPVYHTAVDIDNNYFISGWVTNFWNSNEGTVGTHQPNIIGNYNSLIIKFDSNFKKQWGTYYGGNLLFPVSGVHDKNNFIYGIGTDRNKNIYIAGNTSADANIATSGSHKSVFGGNESDIFIAKIDENGKRIWGTYYGANTRYEDVVLSLNVTNNGTVYISGTSHNSTDISTPNAYYKDIGNHNGFFSKFDTNGTLIWGSYYTPSYSIYYKNNFIYLFGEGRTVNATSGVFMTQPEYGTSYFVSKFQDCTNNVFVTSNSPVCPNTAIKLEASGGTSYSWTGPNGFTSTDQNPIIPNATSANSGTYSCTISGTGDCDGTYTVEVKVEDKTPPNPDITNLPDITGDCHTVVSTIPTATDNCSGKITATTTDALQYSIPGTYNITWKYDDENGNTFSQTQKVIITSPALPTASSSQTFCAIDAPKISDIQITGHNIIWYDNSGNVLNTATPLIDGTTYYASQTINGCESDKISIQVKVNATPLPTGNTNQDFCNSRNAQIKDLAVTGTSLKFYDNLGNVLSNTTVLQNNTSYFVTQTLNNCESPKLEIKVTLTANSLPANDYQLTFCNDTTANSKTEDLRKYQENIITGSSAYIFEYYDQNNNPIADFANTNLIIGFNIFNVKVKSADGCWKMVQLKLQLNPKPVVNLPVNAEFCRGLSVNLDAGSGFKSYVWTKEGTPTPISNAQILNVSEVGKYTVEVTNNSDCKNTSSTLVNQSILANILKVEITNNDAKVLLSANGDFVYSLDNSNWQNNPEFTNLNNGSYTVYVKTKLGCIIGEMNFTIFDIPNTFTPNSDGINDTWKITGMENYLNSEITILDRFGTAVLKKIINGTFEWNGQINSRILPTGTYWYVLKVSDGRILQGYVLIKNRN